MKNKTITSKKFQFPDLWVGKEDGFPTIIYPDATVDYWAGNDPKPQWCRYQSTWVRIIAMRKLKNEVFVAVLK